MDKGMEGKMDGGGSDPDNGMDGRKEWTEGMGLPTTSFARDSHLHIRFCVGVLPSIVCDATNYVEAARPCLCF